MEGLWDERQVELSLDPKVNFLIGANGSGKTTVLNLIASALSSDYEGLARIPFATIECVLSSEKGTVERKVVVARSAEELPRVTFHYRIMTHGQPDISFNLISSSPRYLMPISRHREHNPNLIYDSDESPLSQFVNVKWLPVYRAPAKKRTDERQAPESSVDRRLTSLSNQLVRYFSKLAAQRQRETDRFLRHILAALIYNTSEFDPFTSAKGINLPDVQAAIESLIDNFLRGGAESLKQRVRAHFELAAKALVEKEGYDLDELVALGTVVPMQKIVAEWNETQNKQECIAKPRTEFIDTINSMYRNKKLSLTVRNELEFELLPGGAHLPLSELSSGEKQLLILFAEALLQEQAEFIYIADEPELSLHVTWQEQLTRNLLKINPNAQIIFATHSPDIVSQYGNNAIDMEALFS